MTELKSVPMYIAFSSATMLLYGIDAVSFLTMTVGVILGVLLSQRISYKYSLYHLFAAITFCPFVVGEIINHYPQHDLKNSLAFFVGFFISYLGRVLLKTLDDVGININKGVISVVKQLFDVIKENMQFWKKK